MRMFTFRKRIRYSSRRKLKMISSLPAFNYVPYFFTAFSIKYPTGYIVTQGSVKTHLKLIKEYSIYLYP